MITRIPAFTCAFASTPRVHTDALTFTFPIDLAFTIALILLAHALTLILADTAAPTLSCIPIHTGNRIHTGTHTYSQPHLLKLVAPALTLTLTLVSHLLSLALTLTPDRTGLLTHVHMQHL